MRLIIQIPCYNEEKCLPVTLKELPRKIEGIDEIEWLIINDGSTDNTVNVAKNYGVNHVVNFKKNLGLARAFTAGIEECLKLGADIIVNTDADNQYNAKDICKLVKPILNQEADIVIGTRPIANIDHFSPVKKTLSRFGSWVVKKISKTEIHDAPSGFRAFTREAALNLNVYNNYTYTLETIIHASVKNLIIKSVPIRVNGKLRSSKLMKSVSSYIKKSIFTIFKTLLIYRPSNIFLTLGMIFSAIGMIVFVLSLYNSTNNMLQIMEIVLFILGGQMFIMSLVTHAFSAQRQLLESIQYKLRKMENSNSNQNKKHTDIANAETALKGSEKLIV